MAHLQNIITCLEKCENRTNNTKTEAQLNTIQSLLLSNAHKSALAQHTGNLVQFIALKILKTKTPFFYVLNKIIFKKSATK